jgi:hypothetical protein
LEVVGVSILKTHFSAFISQEQEVISIIDEILHQIHLSSQRDVESAVPGRQRTLHFQRREKCSLKHFLERTTDG